MNHYNSLKDSQWVCMIIIFFNDQFFLLSNSLLIKGKALKKSDSQNKHGHSELI